MLPHTNMTSLFAAAALLSLLLKDGTNIATAWEDEDFFRYCPPSRCHEHGPEIRFPFRLKSSNTSCGVPSLFLSCSAKEDTILDHPDLGPCQVTAIDYKRQVMKITPLVDFLSTCPLQKIKSKGLSSFIDYADSSAINYSYDQGSIVSCLREFTPSIQADLIVGPIPCLSNATHFSYLVEAHVSMYVLALDCKVTSGVIPIPTAFNDIDDVLDHSTFKERAERILSLTETMVSWYVDLLQQHPYGEGYSEAYNCQQCEEHGQRCAFNSQRNVTFCIRNPQGIFLNWTKPVRTYSFIL
jgi:hypothetical protein